MTHGYQFDGSTLRYFVAQIWKGLLDSNDEELKEKMNQIWNSGIRNKNNKVSGVKFKDLFTKDFSLKKNILILLPHPSNIKSPVIFLDIFSVEYTMINEGIKNLNNSLLWSKLIYNFKK